MAIKETNIRCLVQVTLLWFPCAGFVPEVGATTASEA